MGYAIDHFRFLFGYPLRDELGQLRAPRLLDAVEDMVLTIGARKPKPNRASAGKRGTGELKAVVTTHHAGGQLRRRGTVQPRSPFGQLDARMTIGQVEKTARSCVTYEATWLTSPTGALSVL
jgi:hypothetical protein